MTNFTNVSQLYPNPLFQPVSIFYETKSYFYTQIKSITSKSTVEVKWTASMSRMITTLLCTMTKGPWPSGRGWQRSDQRNPEFPSDSNGISVNWTWSKQTCIITVHQSSNCQSTKEGTDHTVNKWSVIRIWISFTVRLILWCRLLNIMNITVSTRWAFCYLRLHNSMGILLTWLWKISLHSNPL